MADETSARLNLPLLFAGQALKELFHNQALATLDMLVQPVVESAGGNSPPATPDAGQCWIVGDSPTGDWAGAAHAIAGWSNGWLFAMPAAGWTAHVRDRGHAMRYDGAQWQDDMVRASGLHIGGVRVVGTRQAAIAAPAGGGTVDTQARVAIGAILAVMRGHGLIAEG